MCGCVTLFRYPDVRYAACYVEQQLLEVVGSGLSDEQRRAVYPELLKRLDDSSNKVQAALSDSKSLLLSSLAGTEHTHDGNVWECLYSMWWCHIGSVFYALISSACTGCRTCKNYIC